MTSCLTSHVAAHPAPLPPGTMVPRTGASMGIPDAVTVCVEPSLHAVNAPTTIGTPR
jgi:hypothetical protein